MKIVLFFECFFEHLFLMLLGPFLLPKWVAAKRPFFMFLSFAALRATHGSFWLPLGSFWQLFGSLLSFFGLLLAPLGPLSAHFCFLSDTSERIFWPCWHHFLNVLGLVVDLSTFCVFFKVDHLFGGISMLGLVIDV